jgi:hypothetical protein
VREGLVLAQQSQKQMFGFNMRAAVLTGLVASKENNSTRLLGEFLEHNFPSILLWRFSRVG